MDRLLRSCLLFLAAALTACSVPDTLTIAPAGFASAQTFTVGETITYTDGLAVTLARVDDSRCKEGVQCIWEGELAPTFELRGGQLGDTARAVTMGTSRTKTATVGAYTLTLGTVTVGAGTPDTATITITRGGGAPSSDSLRVDTPHPGQTVSSPLVVRGSARGPWYFEASFPVTLLDSNGQRLAQTHATAQGDWMTTDWVPFTATLTFAAPTTSTGTLLIENANPSGDPAKAQTHRIDVRFANASGASTGVRGTAMVGPTCPVVTSPPAAACADRPFAGTFLVESVGGTRIADVTSGADGRYALAVPAGSYTLRLASRNPMPSLAPQAFTVRSEGWTTLDFTLDSGIR